MSTAKAELERPTGIGCSELLGILKSPFWKYGHNMISNFLQVVLVNP